MQEEMTGQAIALSAKTVEVSIDILKQLIDVYLEHKKNKSQIKGSKKLDKQPKVKQGKQNIKSLLRQGQGVESIDIDSNNIGLFTSSARKYGVDFAMTKDKTTDPPTHTIFFKGKDTAAITSAFKDFVQREERKLKNQQQQADKKAVRKEKPNKKVREEKIPTVQGEIIEAIPQRLAVRNNAPFTIVKPSVMKALRENQKMIANASKSLPQLEKSSQQKALVSLSR